MGEVYRAVDTRLKRQVAVKILPESFASDQARLDRFQREAELLASLNHPNIAAVFGIENTSAGKALVMELVEGADLRDRIARGALPPAEAMRLAAQLAHAIDAAHSRGIVHRDLKPANIRLRADGTLKVLDFGLAKAVGSSASNDVTAAATHDGVIVGTPRYMSPEQARGETAGTQSDIWAFGVIVFEMLTARAPFDAPTTVETLSRVLHDEPDFARLPASLDPRITLLVRRCLRKNPQQRLHHIGDALLEMEEATSGVVEDRTPRPSPRKPWIVAAIALAALVGVSGWAWSTRRHTTPARIVRSEITSPAPLNAFPMGSRRIAISRDGQRIAISTQKALYIRRLDQQEFVAIAAEQPVDPFFSPDGQSVGFFDTSASGSGLKVVSVLGGTPKLLAPVSDRPAGGDWRTDGTIVFATTGTLAIVRDDGTQLRIVTRPDASRQQRTISWPQFLPDGNTALITIVPTDKSGDSIARINLDTAAMEVALRGGSAARYLPDGRLVFASRDRLKTVAFDPRSPVVAADGAADTGIEIAVAPDNGAADFALSDAGDLLYMPTPSRVEVTNRLYWVDRQGHKEGLDFPVPGFAYPRVSPDGTRIVVDIGNGGNRDIWIYDIKQKRMSQLTFGPTEDLLPLWSRDGARVFFASDRTGNFDIYSKAADGAADDRLEFAEQRIQFPNSFTPDGTGLFVLEDFKDLSLLRFPAPQRLEPVLHGPASKRLPEVSPDGKWLAYESTENGEQPEIFVRPFPDVASRREQISTDGGRYPLWNPAGNNELYFVTPQGVMMAATLSRQTLSVERIVKLFEVASPATGISGRPYDVSRVDGRFLVAMPDEAGPSNEIRSTLILNWAATRATR
jgi:serine/threonine protein kinase